MVAMVLHVDQEFSTPFDASLMAGRLVDHQRIHAAKGTFMVHCLPKIHASCISRSVAGELERFSSDKDRGWGIGLVEDKLRSASVAEGSA